MNKWFSFGGNLQVLVQSWWKNPCFGPVLLEKLMLVKKWKFLLEKWEFWCSFWVFFCGKMGICDGEMRILVQFWMENGCNLPTPPSVSSPNWPLQYVDNIDWDHYHPNWPPFSMLTKLIEITNDPRPKWSFTENTMADIILCVPEERKSLFKPGRRVYTVDVFFRTFVQVDDDRREQWTCCCVRLISSCPESITETVRRKL